jgi:hypothetical protein
MEALLSRITGIVDAVLDRISAVPEPLLSRLVGLSLGVPTTTVLGIAAWLTPSPKGFGTHMQLGLGGCTMLTFTGWPCPMCGMTTTFSLMAHLRVLDALKNQPFGVVLFSLTVVGAGLGIYDAVTGRGQYKKVLKWVQRREQLLAMGLLVGMMLGWAYKSAIMHPEALHFLS